METLYRVGWARFFSKPTLKGTLSTRKGREVWRCPDDHIRAEDARGCAKAMLTKIQDPASAPDDLPRPRPPQFKESAGIHASIPGLSKTAWTELLELFNQRCRYCGAREGLERDHRVPMSRNGQNRISNIVPACRECNRVKGTATEDEYVRVLRDLWGRRVRRRPRRMDDRLIEIERRHAKAAAEDRSATMLRSLKVPRAAWPTSVPYIAVLAVHRKQQVPIAGSSFREDAIEATLGGQREWSGYGALIPEPSNPHDRHAVAVWSSGRKLGYIPQTTSSLIHTEISDLLRRGTALAVRLTLFRTDRGVGGRVKIAVPLTTRAP